MRSAIPVLFFGLAAWFPVGARGATPPIPAPVAVDLADLSIEPRRELMAAPPEVFIGGYEQRCEACHMLFESKPEASHTLLQHEHILLDHGLNDRCYNCHALENHEVPDAKLGLPGGNVPWQTRPLYNEKSAKPGAALYALAKPLMKPIPFGNKLDFIWFELWYHEGRRARHGASMMGPDYTHWHGTYDLAKHFYSEYIPELEELAEDHLHDDDPAKVAAAEALAAKLEEVLATDDHKWFTGGMDPEEAARRAKAAEELRARYK